MPDTGHDSSQYGAKPPYAMLPVAVLSDSRLSLLARLVYAALATYTWDGRPAWPAQATVAALLGRSRRQVSDAFGELVAAGYVESDRRRGRTSLYRLTCAENRTTPCAENRAGGVRKTAHEVDKGTREEQEPTKEEDPVENAPDGQAVCTAYADARKRRGLPVVPTATRRLGQWAKRHPDPAEAVRVAEWMAACDVTDPVLALVKVRNGEAPFAKRKTRRDANQIIAAFEQRRAREPSGD